MAHGKRWTDVSLPWLAAGALLLLIGWRGLTWWKHEYARPPAPIATVHSEGVPPAQVAQDRTPVAEMHLFGRPQSAARIAKKPIPETRAQLRLHGVYLGGDMQGAIIGEAGGRQQFVRTGDSFAKGIELREVHHDHVVLERNGTLEALRFPENQIPLTYAEPPPIVTSTAETGQPLAVVDLSDAGVEEIHQHLRALSVLEEGRFQGYRVLPGRQRGLYEALGLRPGDVITAVDGEPVSESGGPEQFLLQLAGSERLSVTVRRGSRTLQLALDQGPSSGTRGRNPE